MGRTGLVNNLDKTGEWIGQFGCNVADFFSNEIVGEWKRNLVVALIVGVVGFFAKDELLRTRLERQASELVGQISEPVNHTTDDEWIQAYDLVGKCYDSRSPAYLSNTQLKEIIKHYSKK